MKNIYKELVNNSVFRVYDKIGNDEYDRVNNCIGIILNRRILNRRIRWGVVVGVITSRLVTIEEIDYVMDSL
jgi:hypothetical protein